MATRRIAEAMAQAIKPTEFDRRLHELENAGAETARQ